MREQDAGFSVAYPAGWHVAPSPLLSASAASEIFAVGSKPLRPGTTASCAGIPIRAIEDLGAQDALVRISETGGSAPPRRGLFFSGDVRTRTPPSCPRPGRIFYGIVAFEDAGRDLRAFVAWGSKASEATKRDVFAILDSVQVDPAPTTPKRARCGVVDVGGARYGTVMEPTRAGPGDQVVLSGATLRGEDGRYFPADRLEVWFNTKVPVSQVPDASPITPGPILRLATVSDMDSCTFSTHFTVPRVAPGRYKVNVFVFHVGGYGFWLPHFLTVT